MNILTTWLRTYLPELPVDDRQLAEDLTLRGIAVEGEFAVEAPVGGARFEMDITTNRVDAMNHYGVAREAATIYGLALKPLAECGASSIEGIAGEAFPVRIEADDLCGRFTARVVRGVRVGPATGTVADYFAALGQKPISAPVDATNFGWLALGQPTHAFDLDKLEGGIVVRRARAGEKIRLLDGVERTLVQDDLVVADEKKAVGLAGVMGGWDTRVTEETKNILVEAAWFDPAAIRRSSRRHGLHTDASHRFERGADFAIAAAANDFVTNLIVQQCGGTVTGPLVDVVVPAIAARTAERKPIVLRVSEVRRHLGATLDTSAEGGLSAELVSRYLASLGCKLRATGDEFYEVQLPSWRLDLEREIDLIEEVARVYGYNKFANTLPAFTGSVRELPHNEQERTIRRTLRALGFSEAISSTFVSEEDAQTCAHTDGGGIVPMGNPLSAEAGFLRPALAANMAQMLAHNLHRDVAVARLFELGTVFTGSTAEVHEDVGLALGLTGGASLGALHNAADALLAEAKGAVETLLSKFEGTVRFGVGPLPAWAEAGRGALIHFAGAPVGVIAELSAAEAARRKLRAPCVVAELHATALFRTPLREARATDISRFQAVERDYSFVLPDSVEWGAVDAAIRALPVAELQSVAPVEIFRDAKGKAVAAGRYSLLLRVRLQAAERTLTEDDLAGVSAAVADAVTKLGGVQRA